MVNVIWQDDHESIREAAFNHFSSLFKETRSNWPFFLSNRFKKLSDLDASFLESPMLAEEIKEAVWGCASIKAPGPDGFNFKFINTFWDIIKFEFLECVKHFKTSGNFTNGCNSSFIVLIPMRKDPLSFQNYHPISLIGCVYKENGLGMKWRTWISSCLSSSSILVLVNGSLSKEFKLERGLRQGDPFYPFLFLIVVEVLQVTILEACENGLYKGIFIANSGINLSLLLYADDALFFREWSRANAFNLIHIFRCFELASGLKVNIDKSRVMGVGVPANKVVSMASSLGCTHDSLPFYYLRLPVRKRMNSRVGWNKIINRFRDKLSS
ncbi:RNA-directed DNA polymerase, eukaryota [Tanacetum coccineum]